MSTPLEQALDALLDAYEDAVNDNYENENTKHTRITQARFFVSWAKGHRFASEPKPTQ